MKIGIDFDNVLFNTSESFCKVYRRWTGESILMEDMTDWDLKACLPIPWIVDPIFRSDELWQEITPLPGAREAVRSLAKSHELFVVSDTPPHTGQIKADALHRFFPGVFDRNIFFCAHKQMVGVDLLIDDAPFNLICAPYAGILFDYQWNRGFHTGAHHRLARCTGGWPHALKIIEGGWPPL